MLSKEEIEKMKDGLQKQLFNTMQANECGLSNNDFKEDIEILNGATQYIDQLEQENKQYKEFITITGGKDIQDITATKYMQIRREGYIQGRIEEQDKLLKCINKQNKIIDEMAKEMYSNISMLEMAKIGQAIDYDPRKMFAGISDKEAIDCIKQYFEKKVEG